jgi:hypothetical protein
MAANLHKVGGETTIIVDYSIRTARLGQRFYFRNCERIEGAKPTDQLCACLGSAGRMVVMGGNIMGPLTAKRLLQDPLRHTLVSLW